MFDIDRQFGLDIFFRIISHFGGIEDHGKRKFAVESEKVILNGVMGNFFRRTELPECGRDGTCHCTADKVFSFKADFPFGRMHIYIQFIRRHIHKEYDRVVSAGFCESGITFFYSPVDCLSLNRTGIDEYPLIPTGWAGESGSGDESGNMEFIFRIFQRQQIIDKIFAENFPQTVFDLSGCRGLQGNPFVDDEFETGFRVCDRHHGKNFFDVMLFGGGRFEKFFSGRQIGKKISDFDAGADLGGTWFLSMIAIAVALDHGSAGGICGTGDHGEFADRCDRRNCFTSESESHDVIKVTFVEQFAGSVLLQR